MNKRDNDLGFCSVFQNLLTLVYCLMTCKTNKAMQDTRTCISILVESAYAQTCQNLRCSHDLRADVNEDNDNYEMKVDIFIRKTKKLQLLCFYN